MFFVSLLKDQEQYCILLYIYSHIHNITESLKATVAPVIWFPFNRDTFYLCILKSWPLRAPFRLVFCSVWYWKESICKSISEQQYVFMVERSSRLNNYNYQSESYSMFKTASPGFSDFHPSEHILCWVMGAYTNTRSLYALKWLIHVLVLDGGKQ